MPDRFTYAFYFFDRLEETVSFEGKEVLLVSSRLNETPVYYYRAQVMTVPAYKKRYPQNKNIIRGMIENRWGSVIVTCTGEALPLPFEEGVVILSS